MSHIVTYLTHQSLIDKRLVSSQKNIDDNLKIIDINDLIEKTAV